MSLLLWALAASSVLLPADGQEPSWALDGAAQRGSVDALARVLQRAVDASDGLTQHLHVLPPERTNSVADWIRYGSGTEPPVLDSSHSGVEQASSGLPHSRSVASSGQPLPNSSHPPSKGKEVLREVPLEASPSPSSSSETLLKDAAQRIDVVEGKMMANVSHTKREDFSTDQVAKQTQDALEDAVPKDATGDAIEDAVPKKEPVRARFMAPKDIPVALPRVSPKHSMPPIDDVSKLLKQTSKDGSDGEDRADEKESDDLTSLANVLGREGFDATPMGGSVQKIQDLLAKELMPKVRKAHAANQKQLKTLAAAVAQCGKTKNRVMFSAKDKGKYLSLSPLHKTCRAGEAGARTEQMNCRNSMIDKAKIRKLKCAAFAMTKKMVTNQQANRQVMRKGTSESDGNYVKRITRTICGNGVDGVCSGYKCNFEKARAACSEAQTEHKAQEVLCQKLDSEYVAKKSECDSLQDQMDGAACKRAIDMKDACESYAECYTAKKQAFLTAKSSVKTEELDRQTEWRGLKRMECLVSSFSDGKVSNSEVSACKSKTYDTQHLHIKYPRLVKLGVCSVPNRYPTTPAYKLAEFSPLPALAKGKKGAECTGVEEINTTPKTGSPETCKCRRVTMNGPYSGGPIVKCTNCLDVRRSKDKNSCPDGTKLFSPRSKNDWKTFLASARPLRAPHWIVDITRPKNGCGGCRKKSLSSKFLKSWKTSDGSAWWLKRASQTKSRGSYVANCFLNFSPSKHRGEVKWNEGKCDIHSKSYYCQPRQLSLKPKTGSPVECKCDKVQLTGPYSAGALVRCLNCLDVSKSTEKNSCPIGTKLFAPASREDWRTFLDSAKPLRAPNFIVDITRPEKGCPGCTASAMNSGEPVQAMWRTADGAPWWLRSTPYSEPSGDYAANCYMDLWKKKDMVNEDSITFNDGGCGYHSKSYYCQPEQDR